MANLHNSGTKPRAGPRSKLPIIVATLAIIVVLGAVGAVGAMVVIAKRTKAAAFGTFAPPGTSLLVVAAARPTSALTWDDLAAIRTEVPSVTSSAPQLTSRVMATTDDMNWNTSAMGTTPAYFDIRGWKVTKGALFTESDLTSSAKSVVLGQTVSESLYGPTVDPVGRTVRLGTIPFEVIGVLERKGQSARGQDYDDVVLMPATTFQSKIQRDGGKYLRGSVLVKTKSDDDSAQSAIASLLRDRHHLVSDGADDFEIRKLTEVAPQP